MTGRTSARSQAISAASSSGSPCQSGGATVMLKSSYQTVCPGLPRQLYFIGVGRTHTEKENP